MTVFGIAAPDARAQYSRVLIPLAGVNKVPGAYGSLWTASTWVRNDAEVPVVVKHPDEFCGGTCATTGLPRTETALLLNPSTEYGGVFAYAPDDHLADLTFAHRIVDESRQALSAGTEVPVVYERDLFTSTLRLLHVPLAPRFRVLLRVYDFDALRDAEVRVRVYDDQVASNPQDDVAVIDRVMHLNAIDAGKLYPRFPGFASVYIEPPGITGDVRVEISPITPALRFWAFASVTHDETQHVTLVTPQH